MSSVIGVASDFAKNKNAGPAGQAGIFHSQSCVHLKRRGDWPQKELFHQKPIVERCNPVRKSVTY
jgi:hypothetical protein